MGQFCGINEWMLAGIRSNVIPYSTDNFQLTAIIAEKGRQKQKFSSCQLRFHEYGTIGWQCDQVEIYRDRRIVSRSIIQSFEISHIICWRARWSQSTYLCILACARAWQITRYSRPICWTQQHVCVIIALLTKQIKTYFRYVWFSLHGVAGASFNKLKFRTEKVFFHFSFFFFFPIQDPSFFTTKVQVHNTE